MPDGATDLVADLYRRLSEARIADILASRWKTPLGSPRPLTHLRTGEPCRDRIDLLNVLLVEGH